MVVKESPFDWEHVARPFIPMDDLIIYEMHVWGFTAKADVAQPGTFLGIIEKIPYLLDLGINAIELMPIHPFDDHKNYWGYSSINFFAIMAKYGTVHDFKTMVRELHRAGIEVILDVVYNHTSDNNSLWDIDRETYYLLSQDGHPMNFSGCGNTLRANHPVVQELILSSLRYFVAQMRVDGFRFDLASTLSRDDDGTPLDHPPIIEAISRDPILAKTKLIAEPWDPGGLYQVGRFHGRFSEWNGRFRDEVRSFIKGTGDTNLFTQRILGSPDLYMTPTRSINFITAHDGFTLRDLVSYNEKHNEANGEEGRDGENNNTSWNCGVEGQSDDPAIRDLRERQVSNFLLALFVAQGIPMLLMGDEYGHTRNGNNNTWCQDNDLNYFQWGEHCDLVGPLIKLRRSLGPLEVFEIDHSYVALKSDNYFVAWNASHEGKTPTLPDGNWERILGTTHLPMVPYSSIVLRNKNLL